MTGKPYQDISQEELVELVGSFFAINHLPDPKIVFSLS